MKKILTLLLTTSMLLQPLAVLAALDSDTYDTTTVNDWTIRSCQSDSWGVLDYEEHKQGKSSVHLINKTPEENRRFLTLGSTVSLEAGKKYKYGFSAKFSNMNKGRLDFADQSKTIPRYGNSAEWTDYEFIYNCKTSNPQASITFAFDGPVEVWIDDVYVYEVNGDGKNMVKNPSFEKSDETAEEVETNINQSAQTIAESDSFSVNDVKASYATIGYIPVYKVSGYKVDANYDEWDTQKPQMTIPADKNQQVKYLKDSEMDLTADVNLGYDDEYLYVSLRVYDAVHYAFNNSNYWTADSIQLAITGAEEGYNNEMGIVHDEEKKTYGIFSGLTDSQNASMKIATKREGEYTYYDIGLPWTNFFAERPDEVKLDVLVNDNDGQGRIGGIDFSGGGIHATKQNNNFPVLRIMKSEDDYYGWIEGKTEVVLDAEEEYTLYLVNDGEEREFSVSVPLTGYSDSFKVPAKTGIKRRMKMNFPETGTKGMVVEIKTGEKNFVSKKTITIARSFEQLQEYYAQNYPKIEAYHKEILELIKQCEMKNIPTDYLVVGEGVIGRFLEWMQEDYENEELGELEFVINSLTGIYEETKALAQGYLDGTVEAQYVPKYISSNLTVEGGQFYADVDNRGKIERSPVNFVGYLTWFYLPKNDFPLMKKLGNNVIHTEIRMYDLLKTTDVNKNWKVYEGIYHPIEFSLTEESVASGKYALKIVDNTEKWTLNSYRYIYQTVKVKPNTTYSYGMSAKGQNVTNAWFTPLNYNVKTSLNGTYDWKAVGGSYTTGPEETEMTLKIYTENKCDALYIDDLYVCEAGSTENLLKDSGFESGESYEGDEYTINYDYLEEIRQMFQKAEENDVRIDLLLAGHNMPAFLKEYEGIKYTGGGFYPYNMNAPKIKELYEVYIKTLIPAVADYKSFGTVCLTNEPAFNATDASVSDFYHNDWVEFIKKRFDNDLDALNRAFGLDCKTFEEVPMRGGETYSAFEFARKEFADDIFTAWHQWCADLVHECAPHALVHSKMMNEMGDADYRIARNQALIGTSTEKWATFSDINGNDAGGLILGGRTFESEFSYYDLQRSIRNAPVVNSEDHSYGGYTLAMGESTDDEDVAMSTEMASDGTALNMWSGAMHGRGGATIWIYERDIADARNRDYYDSLVTINPQILYKVGKTTLDLSRLAYEVKAIQDQPAEAGIVFAQSGRIMNNSVMNTLNMAYRALLYNGHRVHFVTESTPTTMQNLKLLFVPNLHNVKHTIMDELKKFVDNGGKLIVMGRDSLQYDEHNVPYSAELRDYIMSRAEIMDIDADGLYLAAPTQSELNKAVTGILKNQQLDRVQLVDAKTNEPLYNADYSVTTHEGDLLIQASYINQINEGTKEVKVLINGEQAEEFTDLIANKKYNGSFAFEPVSAVMLKVETNNKFIDTYGHWAESDIVDMTNKEIINGVSETMFAPDETITRAEFTALLSRMLKLEETDANMFADISSNDWFCAEVNAAANAGLTYKTSGDFGGNAKIPREEMAYMLQKAYQLKVGDANSISKNFSDSSKISSEFEAAVQFAAGAGLISGYEDGSFRPQNNLTRAEAVKVLSKLLSVMI